MIYVMTWRHNGIGLPRESSGIWLVLLGLYILASSIRGLASDQIIASLFSSVLVFAIFFIASGRLRFVVTSMLFIFCIGAYPLQAILVAGDLQVNAIFLFWEVSAMVACYFNALKLDKKT